MAAGGGGGCGGGGGDNGVGGWLIGLGWWGGGGWWPQIGGLWPRCGGGVVAGAAAKRKQIKLITSSLADRHVITSKRYRDVHTQDDHIYESGL